VGSRPLGCNRKSWCSLGKGGAGLVECKWLVPSGEPEGGEKEDCFVRGVCWKRGVGGDAFFTMEEKDLEYMGESSEEGRLDKGEKLFVERKLGWGRAEFWRGRKEKLRKSSLGSVKEEEGKEEEGFTDFRASASDMFSVAANERAILCFNTLGKSWDVAKWSPSPLIHLGGPCVWAQVWDESCAASPQCKQRGRLLQALLKWPTLKQEKHIRVFGINEKTENLQLKRFHLRLLLRNMIIDRYS